MNFNWKSTIFTDMYKDSGFTLIEVLVSLAVVGSLVVVLYSLLYHMNLNLEHEDLLRATLLAKEKIYEEPLKKESEEGRFPSPYDKFYYRKTIIDTPFQGIKILRLTAGTDRDLVTMERFIRKIE
ncbi:MAG: type II secretion system GspH family protein [Thermodesulfovibrionales bacterium]|nr:type II secretion system GspH family protein [Thermodesulfovibrionales bacterium]